MNLITGGSSIHKCLKLWPLKGSLHSIYVQYYSSTCFSFFAFKEEIRERTVNEIHELKFHCLE